MSEGTRCQSCSMTIESGDYCRNCSDTNGHLIPFEECVERFLQWTRRQEPNLSPEEARRKTVDFMATMPAWKDHPELSAERAARG